MESTSPQGIEALFELHAGAVYGYLLRLPGVWFGQEGQLIRAYNETTTTAYNAWQIDEWVTIVAVDGIPTRALPLAREVKEVIAEAYSP